MALKDLMDDPKFKALPIAEQHAMLKENFPAYATQNSKDQGEFLYHHKTESLNQPDYGTLSNPKNPLGGKDSVQEDEGFVPRMMQNIGGMLTAPIEAASDLAHGEAPKILQDVTKAREDLKVKAKDPSLGPLSRGAYKVASYIPFLGPQMAQAGEELGSGKYGEGSADALMALFPSMVKTSPFGKGNLALPEGPIVRGARGAYDGAREAPITHPFLKGVAGEMVGHAIDPGLKGAGFATGMLSDKIIGGVKGLFKGPKESIPETGQWQGPEPKPENLDTKFEVKSPIKTKLKVGQSSGKIGDSSKAFKVRRPGIRQDIEPFKDFVSEEDERTERPNTRTTKDGKTQVLRDVPIEHIEGDEGNKIYESKMQELAKKPNPEPPELRPNDHGFTIQEGHHRILHDVRNGKTTIKAWTPEELPEGHESFLGEPYKPPNN